MDKWHQERFQTNQLGDFLSSDDSNQPCSFDIPDEIILTNSTHFSSSDNNYFGYPVFNTNKETKDDHNCEENLLEYPESQQCFPYMEDQEVMDIFIDNAVNSFQNNSNEEQDLEETMSCSNVDNFSPSEAYLLPKESIPPMKMMWTEEEKIKKEIKKRDKHNTIEQRRRENINNRIKELGTLLPPTIHPKLKTCKGSILKASVDYIKELQKSRETLIEVESNIKAMKARNQKMLMKIFQLELKIKLYKLTCDG